MGLASVAVNDDAAAISKFEGAYREFLARKNRRVDSKRLRLIIDGLEGEAAAEARAAQVAGDHLASGNATVVTWLSRLCGMSATSVADRLCVGKQLESLPKMSAGRRGWCRRRRGGRYEPEIMAAASRVAIARSTGLLLTT